MCKNQIEEEEEEEDGLLLLASALTYIEAKLINMVLLNRHPSDVE